MASYPTATASLGTANTGDSIAAAHVNDLRREVEAVEGALLGTITHAVTINGNVTLSGATTTLSGTTVSVSAAATFTARPTLPPPHAAVVYLDALAALGSSAASTLAWLEQQAVTNSSIHSTGTNPERLTPQTTGLYQVTAQIAVSENSTGTRGVVIRDSSATLIAANRVNASTSHDMFLNATGYKRFDALGGYVICEVVSSGASTLSISTGVGNSFFALVKL